MREDDVLRTNPNKIRDCLPKFYSINHYGSIANIDSTYHYGVSFLRPKNPHGGEQIR